MLENLFNNYYFQNVLYCVIFLLISVSIIDFMKKRGIEIKNKFNFKKIDYEFLINLTCLSFFIRIVFEQIQIYFAIKQSDVSIKISVLSLLVFFIVRCIITPITEEIIFRFGLYEFMSTKIKNVSAIILSSIVFSILHGYLIYDTILLTLLSIIWTYSYFKKENLFYPIILHFLHNCYALIGYANINNIYYILFGVITFIIWVILTLKAQKKKN